MSWNFWKLLFCKGLYLTNFYIWELAFLYCILLLIVSIFNFFFLLFMGVVIPPSLNVAFSLKAVLLIALLLRQRRMCKPLLKICRECILNYLYLQKRKSISCVVRALYMFRWVHFSLKYTNNLTCLHVWMTAVLSA